MRVVASIFLVVVAACSVHYFWLFFVYPNSLYKFISMDYAHNKERFVMSSGLVPRMKLSAKLKLHSYFIAVIFGLGFFLYEAAYNLLAIAVPHSWSFDKQEIAIVAAAIGSVSIVFRTISIASRLAGLDEKISN